MELLLEIKTSVDTVRDTLPQLPREQVAGFDKHYDRLIGTALLASHFLTE